MTLAEILKAQNLTDEQVAAITASMKENKVFTAGEENLDIRYGKLKTDFDNLTQQHGEATTLIEQLKKFTKDDTDLQGKVTAYEQQITTLNEQLKTERVKNAIKVGLLADGAADVDYLTFKLQEKGDTLELDDSGNVKGWADKIAALKTQFPQQFNSNSGGKSKGNYDGFKPIDDDHKENSGLTKESILKMPYAERMKVFEENPEGYNSAMHG